MDWTLLALPVLFILLLIVSAIVKSWLGDRGPDHSTLHEAVAVIRARGGPPPG